MKVKVSEVSTLLIVTIAVIVMGYGVVQVKEFTDGLRDKFCSQSTTMCSKRK